MVFLIIFYLFTDWEPEIKISDSPGNYVHIYEGNVLAVDKNNGVFVVWRKESSPYSFIYFSRSLNGGESFEPQKELTFSNKAHTPSIGVAPDGTLYLACTQQISLNYYTVLYKSTDRGNTWNYVSTIGWGPCFYMIVDEAGIIHCVYQGGELGYDVNVAYAKSTDGGFTWNKTILKTTSQLPSTTPLQLIKDKFGNLHLIFHRDTTGTLSGDIYYRRGVNNGNQWENFIKLNQITQKNTFPKIAVDSSNNVYVVWGVSPTFGAPNYRGKVFIAKSTNGGQSFLPETMANGLIDSLRSGFHHYISFDGEKMILFNVWKSGNSLRLYFAKSLDGINWSEDTFLTGSYVYPSGPATPFAVTKKDTYHLIFSNYHPGGGVWDDDIYYKRWVKPQVNLKERITLSLYEYPEKGIFYSLNGRKINSRGFIRKGVYFVKIKDKNLTKSFKILKFE